MTSFARRLVSVALSLASLAPAALAKVTSATLTASPKLFAGNCPKMIAFTGMISVDAPATVTYVFIRSDGGKDTNPKTLTFTAAGTKSIAGTNWTIGGPSLVTPKEWVAIKVTSPNVVESNHPSFEIACDPPLNSVKAAHGNTDWHDDTAREFLTGKDMNGNVTAANFAPSSWTKTHIHTGQTNTAHFYNDPGDDRDGTNGIDKPMLFFYAGHGNAAGWSTLGDNAHQTGMLLGNPGNSGQLRYYWQCSCEVFAHGPQVCPDGADCDYPNPDGFDGSADSAAMRNVFDRWGPAIGPDLRMACGMSTLAYCHTYEVNRVWDDYNNKAMGVVESFMDGFADNGAVIPLCITRGGANIGATPLYDDEFTNQRNNEASTHLHIVYPGNTQSEPPVFKWTVAKIPKMVKVILVDPIDDPVEFRRKLFTERNAEMFRDAQFAGGTALVRRNKESGAIALKAVAASRTIGSAPAAEAQRRGVDVARRLGWLQNDDVLVRTTPLRTASMETASRQVSRGQNGTLVTISRRVRNGDTVLDMLGTGGRIDVELAPDGQVLRAARTWRNAREAGREVPVKPFDRALDEARRKMENAEQYKLADFRLGYKEEAGNVVQRELRVVYQFDFVPRDFAKMPEFPPQRVEVSGVEQ